MRWMVTKKAWALSKRAFPGKNTWVMVPYRLGSSGDMPVYDFELKEHIGNISYTTKARSGRTIITLSSNGVASDVSVPYTSPRRFKVHASIPQATVVGVPQSDPVEASLPKFKRHERARLQDGSMDHGELCTILDTTDGNDGRVYLVLVDGSSKPIEVLEEVLTPNMAGVVADE